MINRRKFLSAMSLMAFTDRLIAGSLSLEDIQSIQGSIGLDAERMEKKSADRSWQTTTKKGYFQRGRKQFTLIRDHNIKRLVQEIAIPLCASSTRKNLDWRVALVGTTNNTIACTTGGGVIYLDTYLVAFCKSEEEFAGVIAHEIGHNEHLHTQQYFLNRGIYKEFSMLETMSSRRSSQGYEKFIKDLNYLAYRGYDRLQENEADAYIVNAFLDVGYDVRRSSACSEMLVRMSGGDHKMDEKTCLYSTHPESLRRLDLVKSIQSTYSNRVKPKNTDLFDELKERVLYLFAKNNVRLSM